jgi:tetratricopeptide (TPR) repeat protein
MKKIKNVILSSFIPFFILFSTLPSYSATDTFTEGTVDSLLLITKYDTTKDISKLKIYLTLFTHYINKHNIDSAKIFYKYIDKTLVKISKKYPDKYFNTVFLLFTASLGNDAPDTSLSVLDRALKVAKEINDKKYIEEIYFSKGIIYWYVKDYSLSTEMFLKAEKLAEELDDKSEMALAYIYLGYIFIEIGDFESAGKFLKSAIVISTTNNIDKYRYYALRNLGLYFFRKGDYQNAEEYFLKSINGFEKMKKYDRAIVLNYNFLINLYLDVGDYDKAATYLKNVMTMDLDTFPIYFKAYFYKNLGRYYLDKEIYQKAILYLKKHIDYFYKYYFRDYEVYRMLGNAYYYQNNEKLSFYFYRKSYELMDSTYRAKLTQSNYIHSAIFTSEGNSNKSKSVALNANITITDLGMYYFKTYKVYILATITLIVLFILYLIIKLWLLSRKNSIAKTDIEALLGKIKRLERTIKEVEEFSFERADLLEESISKNNELSKKYEKVLNELKITQSKLEKQNLKFAYTIKGPLNTLINLLELLQKKYTNEERQTVLLKNVYDIIRVLKWKIILNYGYEKTKIEDVGRGIANLPELLEVVIASLDYYEKSGNVKIEKYINVKNLFVLANDKILARVIYSLFVYFLDKTKNANVKVSLSEENNEKYLLTILFIGEKFSSSHLNYLTSLNNTYDIVEKDVSGNIFDLPLILTLLKNMGFEVELFYDDKQIGFNIKGTEEKSENIKSISVAYNKLIKGNFLNIGFYEDEKFLISETLKSFTDSPKDIKLSWVDTFEEALEVVRESYTNKKLFDLVLVKISLHNYDFEKYKQFLNGLRNVGVEYFKIQIIAILDDYNEEIDSTDFDYFSDIIFKPFDIDTFLIKVKSHIKNTTFGGIYE